MIKRFVGRAAWKKRALDAEAGLRDIRACQERRLPSVKGVIGPRWGYHDAEGKLVEVVTANSWKAYGDHPICETLSWVTRALSAEAERDKALRKMVCSPDEPTDQSEPEAPGWQEHLQYIVDAAVCTFSEMSLGKWCVCITRILEALDSKCENKTAFRAVIEGVRDDIDHRLQYGRW